MESAEELRRKGFDQHPGVTIGPIEAVSRETDEAIFAELDGIFDRIAPRAVNPEDVVVHDFREPPLRVLPTESVPGRGGEDLFDRCVNQTPEPDQRGVLRTLGRNILKRLGFLAVIAGAPIPQMQLQRCFIGRAGNVSTVSCDSADVCPSGWVLATDMDDGWPNDGEGISQVFGYGQHVRNSCERPSEYGRRIDKLFP